MMKLIKINNFLLVILTMFSANAFCQNDLNDIFTIETIDRETNLVGDIDDYYYSINYIYSNVATKDDDSFWKSVKGLFTTEDSKVVFQVNQEIKSGQSTILKASKVLSVFNKDQNLIGSDVSYHEKIIPPRRYQNSDSIKIQASLSEITSERAATLRLILDELNEVPLVTSFTQGGITVASNIIDAITGVSSGPTETRKIGSYTLQGTKELSNIGYIAIIAKGDQEKFKKLINNTKQIPKTINELNRVDIDDLPSFVLMEIKADKSLYSPSQILSVNSSVRPLIENDIEAISNAQNNKSKAEQCTKLRSALNYLGPLSSEDESYAAMAALKKANYDPERTVWHERVGCLTFEEIESAKEKFPSFKFGKCISQTCRAVNNFINSWVAKRSTNVSADTINWFTVLNGDYIKGTGTDIELLNAVDLRRRYGNITPAGGGHTYTVIGALFDKKNGKTCHYDVEIEVNLKKFNKLWKVDSVGITETDKVFDDGQSPSQKWKGLKKCSDV